MTTQDETNDETNYERQLRLVETALTALGTDTPRRGSEIKAWLAENRAEEFAPLQASWGSYLSRAVADPTNRIERTPGSYTYSLRAEAAPATPPPAPVVEEPTECVDDGSARGRPHQQREQLLYPTLATWLRSRGYAARVTAHGKKGRAWGNPDVTGIDVVDGLLGQKSLEIATVEAKISSYNWRYFFFEAVAHKRFAHRAYFAFGHGSDEPTLAEISESEEMREYGEKYGVGIVVVFMPSETYNRLASGDVRVLELALDEVRVEELWPAIHDEVTARAQAGFLREVLEIAADRDIYLFDPENA